MASHTPLGWRPLLLLVLTGLAGTVCDAALAADDVVYLLPEAGGRGPRSFSGQVVDYTGRELRLRLSTGKERAIPTAQIEHVETTHSADQAAGDELFADHDYRLALAKYRSALETDRETRGWMRRQILAQVVWCQRATGQWDQAGETFLMLLPKDPDTPYFDCIPLAWTTAQTSGALEAKAKTWLARGDNPTAVLIGASHLLTTRSRPAALEKLTALAENPDPRIAWLAQTQLWRTTSTQAGENDLRRWGELLEKSPESLRAGPCFVLGSAWISRDPELAALLLMKLPILYSRERTLSAAALLSAGGCLEKISQKSQAAEVYRELLAGYAELPEAGEAKRRLLGLAAAEKRN